ncbi:MAG: acetoin utilization protein AcuC [Rhodospirillales bacterium]
MDTTPQLESADAAVDRGPFFIGSEIYRDSSYGRGHPLAIPRVSVTMDLCRALGWLDEARFIVSPMATADEIARFHDPEYVAALAEAERRQSVTEDHKARFNIGVNGNPVYPEMFRRPATSAGAAMLAARLLAGGATVYSPAGGTHHGRRSGASGFCYFNDPVLAILTLLDEGVGRVFYLDVDAHWGDGVQAAFDGDDRVFTLSIHENGRWPMTRGGCPGSLEDRSESHLNLPVAGGFSDSDLDFLMDYLVVPLIDRFQPGAIVLQGGCDGLADDPMSKLMLSNRALWRVVERMHERGAKLLVFGGGGYNPYAVARCWAGVWGVLAGEVLPEVLPNDARVVLQGLNWQHRQGRDPQARWLTTLADPPGRESVSENLRALVALALRAVRL